MTNRDGYEGYNYSPKNETTEEQETADLELIFPYAKGSFFQRLYQLYPASDFKNTLFQRQTIYGDYIIACPTYYFATAASDWGLPTYKMIFQAGTELHGADGPSLWGPSDAAPITTIAEMLKDYYVGFVSNLDPNSYNSSRVAKPSWTAYQAGSDVDFNVLSINYTQIGVTPDPDANARCDFFHGKSWIVRN